MCFKTVQKWRYHDSCFVRLQILEENVAVLGNGVKTVGAALAPQHLAGSSVNFVGRQDQYWGFRVLPDDQLKPDMLVHKVPTKSLNDIKVQLVFSSILLIVCLGSETNATSVHSLVCDESFMTGILSAF